MRIRSILVSIILITPAAVAMADCPVNFVYRDAKGNVHDFHFDGKAWQKLQLNNGGMTAAPAASGDPSAFALGAPSFFSFASPRWILPADHRDFSYVGANGDLHHIFHQGGKWAHDLLNNAGLTSAPPSAGQVAATAFNLRQLTYTFRDPDGNLQHIASFEENWHGYRLNNGGRTSAPRAGGDPAILEGEDRDLDLAYPDAAGGIQHLHWGHGSWTARQLNLGGITEAPAAAGNPILLQGADHQLHCAYRDISGNLHLLTRAKAKWNHVQLNNGGTTSAPLAAGDPAGTVGQGGQLDWVYRNQDASLQHLFLKEGKWGSEELATGGAPSAASGPWIRYAADTLHAFYLDAQGNLQHLSGLQGKWSAERVNEGAHVTMALPVGGLKFY